MTNIILVICSLTCFACTCLLVRAYRRTQVRILFWGSVCFLGLMLNNMLLVIDTRIPWIDLAPIRAAAALIGVLSFLYGLITEQ